MVWSIWMSCPPICPDLPEESMSWLQEISCILLPKRISVFFHKQYNFIKTIALCMFCLQWCNAKDVKTYPNTHPGTEIHSSSLNLDIILPLFHFISINEDHCRS